MPFWNAPENHANEALRRAIDQSLAVISFDPGGKILGANANFLKSMGYSENEVVRQHHRMFADEAFAQSEAYRAFWASLRAGHYEEGEFCRRAAGTRTSAADRSTVEMRQAAQSMTGVLDLITQITGEINLLALNATIESARAGEAGRGFAVVANEVKILASQTSAATSRISGEIAAMQDMSDHVVSALNSITSVVGDVQGFVDEAAHSMQEQSQVTHDISANMHVAAEGVADIGRNLDDWIIGMEERRFEARVRTSKPAVTICADGTRLSCSVRNVSKSGAKLVMANARSVPDHFDLEISSEGALRKCAVARRGATEIGIRFVEGVQMPLAGAA